MNGFYVATGMVLLSIVSFMYYDCIYNHKDCSPDQPLPSNNAYDFICSTMYDCPQCVFQGLVYMSKCVRGVCDLCSTVILPPT